MEQFITALYAFYDDWGFISQYMIGELSPLQPSNKYSTMFYTTLIFIGFLIILYNTRLRDIVPNKSYRKIVLVSITSVFAMLYGMAILYNDYYDGQMVSIDPLTNLMIPLDVDFSCFWDLAWNNLIISLMILVFGLFINHYSIKFVNSIIK